MILGSENAGGRGLREFVTRATGKEIAEYRRWSERYDPAVLRETLDSIRPILFQDLTSWTKKEFAAYYRETGELERLASLKYFAGCAVLEGEPLKTRRVTELTDLVPGLVVTKVDSNFRKALKLGDVAKSGRRRFKAKRKNKKKKKRVKQARETLKKDQLKRGLEAGWAKVDAAIAFQKCRVIVM